MHSFLSCFTNVLSCSSLWLTFGLMAPKLRGGHKQKRQRILEAEQNDEPDDENVAFLPSALGTGLLVKWSQGQLTATDVQEFANLAMKDGATHPEVAWLAGIGSSGASKGNCSRALNRRYLKDMSLPDPYFIKVKVQDSKDRGTLKEVDVPVLLPHEWFGCL